MAVPFYPRLATWGGTGAPAARVGRMERSSSAGSNDALGLALAAVRASGRAFRVPPFYSAQCTSAIDFSRFARVFPGGRMSLGYFTAFQKVINKRYCCQFAQPARLLGVSSALRPSLGSTASGGSMQPPIFASRRQIGVQSAESRTEGPRLGDSSSREIS